MGIYFSNPLLLAQTSRAVAGVTQTTAVALSACAPAPCSHAQPQHRLVLLDSSLHQSTQDTWQRARLFWPHTWDAEAPNLPVDCLEGGGEGGGAYRLLRCP